MALIHEDLKGRLKFSPPGALAFQRLAHAFHQRALFGVVFSLFLLFGQPEFAVWGSGPVQLSTVLITDEIGSPIYVTHAPADLDRVFIAVRPNRIMIVENGLLRPEPFLELPGQFPSSGGIFNFAFHPDYANNRAFFVYYTRPDGSTVVSRFLTSQDDPNDALEESESILLTVADSPSEHSGSLIGFGPNDGYLYIATGDFSHGCAAQSTTNQFKGKILRISVGPTGPYTIPPDNPLVGAAGDDEIWAWGLRNPWRSSFDLDTGQLYVADVGGALEEVNVLAADQPGGANFGWPLASGTQCTTASCQIPPDTCPNSEWIGPVYEYPHSNDPFRCAIIGGEVYNGCTEELRGTYFFADWCSDEIWSMKVINGVVSELVNRTLELQPADGRLINSIVSFGRDARGDIYICDSGGEVFKIVADDLIDCNKNCIDDAQDIASGTSTDCDADAVPDECQDDCNGNGVPDPCDIASPTSEDCDANGTPDECDPDFDQDGLIDACDPDADNDGVANEIDVCPMTPSGHPVNGQGRPPADTNGNCVLDLEDWRRMAPCLLENGAGGGGSAPCLQLFDTNKDGMVNIRDVAAFVNTFGG